MLPADESGPDDQGLPRRTWTRASCSYDPVLADFKQPVHHRLDAVPGRKKYIETCDTTVPLTELKRLAERLTTMPEGFSLHPRVKKIIDDRAAMGEGKLPVDWGMAENLAYASLLVSGYRRSHFG